MLRRPLLSLVAVGLLFQTSAAFGHPMAPTGKWVVDYRTDQCLASREYGTSDDPVTLGIRPAPNGKTFALLLARKGGSPKYGIEQETTIDFGNGPIKSWLLEYGSTPRGSNIYQFRISAAEMEQAKTAASLKLRLSDAPDAELELQSMPALISTLGDCTANLKSYWNMGGEKDGRISKGAKGDIRSLFSPDDYPAEAQRLNQTGTSQFVLLIDEKGNVAGCDVVDPSGVPVLDVMSCDIIRERGKFTPAFDSKGEPVRSTYVTPPVKWFLG